MRSNGDGRIPKHCSDNVGKSDVTSISTAGNTNVTITYDQIAQMIERDFGGECASPSGYVLGFSLYQDGRFGDDKLAYMTVDLENIASQEVIEKPVVDIDRECGIFDTNFCIRSNAKLDVKLSLQ